MATFFLRIYLKDLLCKSQYYLTFLEINCITFYWDAVLKSNNLGKSACIKKLFGHFWITVLIQGFTVEIWLFLF